MAYDPFRNSPDNPDPQTATPTIGQYATGLGGLSQGADLAAPQRTAFLGLGGVGYNYPVFGDVANPSYVPPPTPPPAPTIGPTLSDPGAAPPAAAAAVAPAAPTPPAPDGAPALGREGGGEAGESASSAGSNTAEGPASADSEGGNGGAGNSAESGAADAGSDSGGSDTSGGGSDTSGGGDSFAVGGRVGSLPLGNVHADGPPGYESGGGVSALVGPKPPNADDGYASLQQGEFVVRNPEAQRYLPILEEMNEGAYQPGGGETEGTNLMDLPDQNADPDGDGDNDAAGPDPDASADAAGAPPGPAGGAALQSGPPGNVGVPDMAASLTPQQAMQNVAVLAPEQRQMLGMIAADPTLTGALVALLGPAFTPVIASLAAPQGVGPTSPGAPPAPPPSMPPPGAQSAPPPGAQPPGFAQGGRYVGGSPLTANPADERNFGEADDSVGVRGMGAQPLNGVASSMPAKASMPFNPMSRVVA